MSDSEGEEKSSFTVPRYKGNYVEFEPQLLAYATLKGCDIAYEPNEEADYFPRGEGDYSDNEITKKKQKTFVKKNLHAIVVLNQAFTKHSQLPVPKGRAWYRSETHGFVVDAVPDINPYPYDLILYPGIFVCIDRAMNFNERPLDADAAQRSFNHFYLEEQIERNVRLARLEEDSALGNSTYSQDPALVEVMSVLCPSYASAIKQALESGLDEDAVGIFSYESEDDGDQEMYIPMSVDSYPLLTLAWR